MNLGQLLKAYAPQIAVAVGEFDKTGDPTALTGLLPDMLQGVASQLDSNERRSKASFIAHLAGLFVRGEVETCESDEEATELARRAVLVASKIVSESERVAGVQ